MLFFRSNVLTDLSVRRSSRPVCAAARQADLPSHLRSKIWMVSLHVVPLFYSRANRNISWTITLVYKAWKVHIHFSRHPEGGYILPVRDPVRLFGVSRTEC